MSVTKLITKIELLFNNPEFSYLHVNNNKVNISNNQANFYILHDNIIEIYAYTSNDKLIDIIYITLGNVYEPIHYFNIENKKTIY